METVDETDIYERIGADQPFIDLVDEFYRAVETDQVLRSVYPHDLTPGKQHLAWFLIQRFGGPDYFNERRGAPRLRMRHAGFAVTRDQAKRWTAHMRAALDRVEAFAEFREPMARYFEDAALFLINSETDGVVNLAR